MDRAKLDLKFVAGDHLTKATTLNPDGNRATHLHRLSDVISLKERVAFIESNRLLQAGPPERLAEPSFYHWPQVIEVSAPGKIGGFYAQARLKG